MIQRREARLDLDLALVRPDPALIPLLRGEVPRPRPPHPLFEHPDAALLLRGESLDHATTGSRLVREGDGTFRLVASASLPPDPALLTAGLDWIGAQADPKEGELVGFVVPAGAPRHDMRLLTWHAGRIRLLPAPPQGELGCDMAEFARAADLPPPDAAGEDLAEAIRRVAGALAARQALPVAQARLDGALPHGQATFLVWLAQAAETQHGFTTRLQPLLVQ